MPTKRILRLSALIALGYFVVVSGAIYLYSRNALATLAMGVPTLAVTFLLFAGGLLLIQLLPHKDE